MRQRITENQLRALVLRINEATNSARTPYKEVEGKLVGQIGNYHLSFAYGGVSLHRMANEHGGVRDVLGCGHMAKRELYEKMHAYLLGMDWIVAN
jgi:hypothetical protein